MDSNPKPAWMSKSEVARALDISMKQVSCLERDGLIRVRNLGTVQRRFLRVDVEKLARESIAAGA